MNSRLLKGVYTAHGDTQQDIANYLGIALGTFSAKIKGHRSFSQNEIIAMKERYSLSAEQVDSIFFDEKCSCTNI